MQTKWTLIIVGAVAVSFGIAFAVTEIAAGKALALFEKAGFAEPHYGSLRKSLGAVIYNDISFDEDNISTIAEMRAAFTLGGDASLLIEKLDMTGDIYDGLSITGFEPESFPFVMPALDIERIILKNARLGLLTTDFGGLTLDYSAQAFRKDTGLEVQARFTSAQPQITISGQASGMIASQDWSLQGDIEEAKIDLQKFHMKFMRGQGQFSASQTLNDPILFNAQITAGGAEIYGLPWQNAAVTLEILGTRKKIYINAVSFTDPPIEMNMTWEKDGDNAANVNVMLYSQTGSDLLNHLKKHNKKNLLGKLQSLPASAQGVSAALGYTEGQTALIAVKADSGAKPMTFKMNLEDLL